jgi:hypothetical protein
MDVQDVHVLDLQTAAPFSQPLREVFRAGCRVGMDRLRSKIELLTVDCSVRDCGTDVLLVPID